ncbi:MAG: hypothetical protein FJX77_10840, partial [Armatimonadetes bacterium]|nr:hypothetical protein [Armatimonadota bacterium]
MPARSLRAQVTLLYTLTVTGLMLLVGAGILGWSFFSADQLTRRVLAATVRRVRAELAETGELESPAELIREEGDLLEHSDGAMVLFGADGTVLAQSRQQIPGWPRTREDGWRVAVVPGRDVTVVVGISWG